MIRKCPFSELKYETKSSDFELQVRHTAKNFECRRKAEIFENFKQQKFCNFESLINQIINLSNNQLIK